MTLTMPFSWTVCHREAGIAMIKLPTKFEVPNFTCNGDMKGAAKGVEWLGVTGNVLCNHSIQRIQLPVHQTRKLHFREQSMRV